MGNSISFAKNVHNSNQFRGKITKCKVDSKDCFFTYSQASTKFQISK